LRGFSTNNTKNRIKVIHKRIKNTFILRRIPRVYTEFTRVTP